jgi:hypothetical protein
VAEAARQAEICMNGSEQSLAKAIRANSERLGLCGQLEHASRSCEDSHREVSSFRSTATGARARAASVDRDECPPAREQSTMQRTLFGVERLFGLLEEIPANGLFCVRIHGSLGEEQLRGAIDKLQRRHPLLRARLIRDHGEVVFTTEGTPRIPLQVIQDDGDGRTWLRVAPVEYLRVIDTEQGPLVRFVMVCHPLRDTVDLIMIAHHVVGDGASAILAVRDILAFIEHPEREVEPLPMLPPLGEMLPEHLTAPAPFPPAPSLPTGLAPPPSTGLDITPASLPPEVTRALAARCKRHGVTVHSAICAALANRIAIGKGKPRVVISCPVNLRPRLRQDAGDACGLFMMMVDVGLDVSSSPSLWELARQFHAAFDDCKTDDRLFGAMVALDALLRPITNEQDLFRIMPPHQRNHDIAVSNLGKLPIPTRHGNLVIESMHGVACAPGEVIVIVFTIDDTMYFTLSARDLPSAEVASAKQMFFEAMNALTRSSS